MRAIVFGFLELDRAVAGEELAVFDRTGARTLTIGAKLRLVDSASLLSGSIFAELTSDLAADVVSTLFDRGEIEVVEGFVGAEDVLRKGFEKMLEARVEFGIRGGVKHGGLP